MLNGKVETLYRGCQSELRWAFRASCGLHRRQNGDSDTVDNFPDDGLVENFCRNPGAEKSTIWCYTSEGGVAWAYCQPLPLVKAPLPAAQHECVESGSCKMSGASCKRLTDRFMLISGISCKTTLKSLRRLRRRAALNKYSIPAAETQATSSNLRSRLWKQKQEMHSCFQKFPWWHLQMRIDALKDNWLRLPCWQDLLNQDGNLVECQSPCRMPLGAVDNRSGGVNW